MVERQAGAGERLSHLLARGVTGLGCVFVSGFPFPTFFGSIQIPEYCRALEENEISEHCFDLIFAFDEIVALGYRENVNLAQIRTFTEMDSHEEKVFRAVREVGQGCTLFICSCTP